MCNRSLQKKVKPIYMAKAKNKLPKPLLALPIFIIKKVFNVKPIGEFATNEKLFFQ
jgi:hypothetical protein